MKAKKSLVLLAVCLSANLVFPTIAGAESLDTLNQQESKLNDKAKAISSQIDSAVDEADKTLAQVQDLQTKIADNQGKLTATQSEIQETQATIKKRKKAVAERMKDVQVNGTAERSWQALLDANSLTEFVNRAYAMNVLQNAEKEKVVDLNNEKTKLEALQKDLSDTQAALKKDQASLETEAQNYVDQVSDLKQQLADNQDLLTDVLKDKEAEQQRLAAEEAKKAEAEAQAKAEAEAAQKAAAAQQAAAATQTASNNDSTASTPVSNENSGNKQNVSKPSSTVTEMGEVAAKEWIAMRESSGSYTASNGRYYGRYQLDKSYLNGDLSPANQERVADSYVKGRYGSWSAAQAFWQANGWY